MIFMMFLHLFEEKQVSKKKCLNNSNFLKFIMIVKNFKK